MIHACHTALSGRLDLAGFLALGILGSFGHCSAMCSPFVLFVSRQYCAAGCSRRATLGAQLWYHAGRLTTYASIGAAAGALGSAIELAGRLVGLQRSAAIVAGAVLVLFASSSWRRLIPVSWEGGGLLPRLTRMAGRRPGHPLVAGLLLGFLPCGLLYSAVVAAAGLGGALHGAIALAMFGAGTVPTLLGISVLDRAVAGYRAFLNRAAQALMFAAGLWFVWLGLTRAT